MIDAKLLASAIERMEAEIALFPESEFPVEHEQTRAVVAAAKAYEPLRAALDALGEAIAEADELDDPPIFDAMAKAAAALNQN
jgi:hypothetical protein